MNKLPIDINDLISGKTVEWERIEFKKGWNPESILHTICAFANDINNWGRGYIVVGAKEKNGRPILPPTGLNHGELDNIQKKLLEICHLLQPQYFPIVIPTRFQEKQILVIWAPGGDRRPYKAPVKLFAKSSYNYYIRRNSSTIKSTILDEQNLHRLASKIPFDDRINHQAKIEDIDVSLISSFLKKVGSKLYKEVKSMNFVDLCKNMHLVNGPMEYIKPLNIGLLMFNEHPEHFFPLAQIEIVHFHDEIGDSFSEKIFQGPLDFQLKEALKYIKNQYLKEEVRKISNQAEAYRFYNYPYEALEEILANALYHKDYEIREPVEVRIHADRIEVLSFSGPLPPVTQESLNSNRIISRMYRNRRIGDFLKELQLTEGRSTGIPKIQNAMNQNGSLPVIFETDKDRTYFLSTLHIHPKLKPKTHQLSGKTHQLSGKTHHLESQSIPINLKYIIKKLNKRASKKELRPVIQSLCSWKPLTAQEIANFLERKSKKDLVDDHLTPMIKAKELSYVNSEDPNNPNQAYITPEE